MLYALLIPVFLLAFGILFGLELLFWAIVLGLAAVLYGVLHLLFGTEGLQVLFAAMVCCVLGVAGFRYLRHSGYAQNLRARFRRREMDADLESTSKLYSIELTKWANREGIYADPHANMPQSRDFAALEATQEEMRVAQRGRLKRLEAERNTPPSDPHLRNQWANREGPYASLGEMPEVDQ